MKLGHRPLNAINREIIIKLILSSAQDPDPDSDLLDLQHFNYLDPDPEKYMDPYQHKQKYFALKPQILTVKTKVEIFKNFGFSEWFIKFT